MTTIYHKGQRFKVRALAPLLRGVEAIRMRVDDLSREIFAIMQTHIITWAQNMTLMPTVL